MNEFPYETDTQVIESLDYYREELRQHRENCETCTNQNVCGMARTYQGYYERYEAEAKRRGLLCNSFD